MNNKRKFLPAKILLIVFGGFLTLMAVLSIKQYLFFILVNTNFSITRIYLIFMPFLTVIGLSYLYLGFKINKIQKRKQIIHIVTSIALNIWYVLYLIVMYNSNSLSIDPSDISMFLLVYYYGLIGAVFVVFITMQVIIGIQLYKLEKQNNNS